ncbi:MAG: hypothetical protein WCL70_07920 [Paludibacter sp.]
MKHYSIEYSEEARTDINNLFDVIIYEYKAPTTAFKYVQGLYNEIKKLSRSAESFSVQTRKSLQQYGPSPRRLNYKRMTVIYNVINDVVYIRRVIPSNTIAGL